MPPRPLKLIAVMVLGLSGLLVGGLEFIAVRSAADPPLVRRAPPMKAPVCRDRILVLAPHPDDESASCGGLIALAAAAQAALQVIYVTNGDGFRVAAEKLFAKTNVPAQDYLRLAGIRQREAVAALARLGVDRSRVTFLGYPDKGLDRMWRRNWAPTEPYRSRYTKTNHVPYPDSFRPGAPYCGRALLDDLKVIIQQFKPTMVIAPHPRDAHSDHWALYCFTVSALYELGLLDKLNVYLYLLRPLGRLQDPSSPPLARDDVGTRWESLSLTRGAQQRKREAIMEHQSQRLVMRDFLASFARPRELYGQAPARLWRAEVLRPKAGLRSAVLDSDSARGGEKIPAAADILAVRLARCKDMLSARLDLAQRPSDRMRYQLHLHELVGGKVMPPRSYSLQLSGIPPRAAAALRLADLPAPSASGALWRAETTPDGLVFSVETWLGSRRLDHTPWVLLLTSPAPDAR